MKVKERNKIIIQMVIAIIGVVGGVLGVNAFNQYVLMSLPLVVRMVLMIVTYLPIALVPFCIVFFNKDKWSDYGFSKEKTQISRELETFMETYKNLEPKYMIIYDRLAYYQELPRLPQ